MNKKQLILVLHITNQCNLNCNYCFVKKVNCVIDECLAKKSIDLFANRKEFDIILTFLGGEPLLEWSLIKEIVNYSERKGIDKFNLATNGLLVDNKKMLYFHKHKFKIQLSFDGIKESQDSSRQRINGQGTFCRLNKILFLFLKYSRKINFEIRITLTKNNLEFLAQSIIFMLKKGIKNNRINIMPVIKEPWSNADFERLRGEANIIKKYYKNLKITPNIFINECIEKEYSNISCLSDKCSCGWGKRVICIDYKGKAYPCFIPAGLDESRKKRFIIGDFYKGVMLNKYSSRNKYLSCPVWTTLYKDKAVDIYKNFYSIWAEK